MSNYTKTTNFATKDSLASGNPNKIVKGAEINSEFDNIATAVATKADTASPSLTGTVTAAALNVTGNLDVDGTLEFDSISGTGSVAVTDIADEDNMSSNSATKLATQQSIKAYVDSQVTAQDLDLTDGTTSISIDLDSEALSVLGGTGVTSTASGNGVTLAIDSTVTTLTGSQTLTNKTLTSPDINTPDIDGGTIDGTVIGGSSAAAGSFTTVGATGNITVGGTVDGRDVATDGTKLDGIEASADVTDTTNVTAAGALMDSELTSIASVKALNQGVATTDSPTFAAVTVNGNVEFDGLSGTGSVTVTDILDQDDMSGNSATALATQQSIKAYVDAQQDTVDTLAEILALSNATGGTNIVFGDSSGVTDDRLVFGAGSDLQIYHDGSNSFIQEGGTGDLKIRSNKIRMEAPDSQNMIIVTEDAGVSAFYNGTKRLEVTNTGIDVTGGITATSLDISGDIDVDGTTNLDVVDIDGAVDMASTLQVDGAATFTTEITANGGIALGDNDKATFGDAVGGDLQIYHDGSNSYIKDVGTGSLKIQGVNLNLQSTSGESYIDCVNDGTVYVYHNNSPKLATTSTGIDVTGTATMDGLTVNTTNGSSVFEGTGVSSVGLQFKTNASNRYLIQTPSASADLAFLAGGTTKSLNLASNGDISFYEDTGTTPKLFWDASAESLGIGTDPSSYSNTLVADQGGNYTGLHNQAAILVRASTGTAGVGNHQGAISFSQGTGQAAISGVQESSDNDVLGLAFWTHDSGTGTAAAVERMRIDNQGRVGIGTSSPSAPLHIDAAGMGDIYSGLIQNSTTDTDHYNVVRFMQGASGSATGYIGTGGSATGNPAFRNSFVVGTQTSSPLVFTTSDTERMRIDSSGNLLVGVTSPQDFDSTTTNGHTFYGGSTDVALHSRNNANPLALQRTGNDGSICNFYKDTTTVGSIGTIVGDGSTYLIGPNTGIGLGSTSVFPMGGSATISNGVASLGFSGGRFKDLYLSGGVYLGGTGAANKLDDYEEGTWTPTVYASDGTTVLTLGTDYAIRTARYTKIGQLVRLSIRIEDLRATKENLWFTVPFTSVDNDAVVGSILPSAQLTASTYGTASIYATYTKFRLTKGNYQYPYGSCSYITNS